jgi:hypothetical protein
MSGHERGVKYLPPSQDVLVHFAQTVGAELGPDYADPDIVHGLADFMGVVARVLANEKNRKVQGEFDSRIE